MATSLSVCAVCDLQHQTTQSTHWCIECEEPLCSDCRENHTVKKETENHKYISILDYQLLPSVLSDINQHCVYHNEMYELYCTKHDSPICHKCAEDHGKCGKIHSLEDVVCDIKTSDSFVDIEQSVDDIFTNINLIRKDKESNIESIADQKKKITEHVYHLKKQFIQHVNKLEEEFIKELDQIEFDCSDPIHSIVSSLQDKAKEITQMKSEIKNTKKYASNLQAFLRVRDIQTKTTEYEKHLQSCIQNEYQEKIIIESETDSKIYNVLTVERLGSIKVKKIPSTKIDLIRRKDRQAQIVMVPEAITSITNSKFELIQKFNTACKHPSGCCVTHKGEFLFTNYDDTNDKIIARNVKGDVIYTIPIKKPYAFDVVCIDDSRVAVSTGFPLTKSGISVVDLNKKKVIKFIDVPGYTYGINYDGTSLICCVKDKDLHVISCTDYSITTIPNTTSSYYSYVSTHADKIFFTNPDKCKVTCCSYSGVLVWEFEDPVLDYPQGITVDNNNGNVFVAGNNSCNVVVLSPDGKQCKQILTKEDGHDRTTAIFFDKVRNLLLVTNENRFAYIFNVLTSK